MKQAGGKKPKKAELKQESITFSMSAQEYLDLASNDPPAAVQAVLFLSGAERVRLAVCLSATKPAGAAGAEYNYWLRYWEESK